MSKTKEEELQDIMDWLDETLDELFPSTARPKEESEAGE